jgi:hypothetical protein
MRRGPHAKHPGFSLDPLHLEGHLCRVFDAFFTTKP